MRYCNEWSINVWIFVLLIKVSLVGGWILSNAGLGEFGVLVIIIMIVAIISIDIRMMSCFVVNAINFVEQISFANSTHN